MQDYTVVGIAPDLTEAAFVAILQRAGSPARAAAPAVWQYCRRRGVSPAFLLALFRQESGFGLHGTATLTHSYGNTRSPSFGGVPEIGTVPGRSGVFPVFANWVDGGISTAARFLDHAPYRGKTTVRTIIPIWAPPTDLNDPDAYARAVLASIEQWTKGAPPVAVSKPTVVSSPSPNRNGYGGVRQVSAICWHVTAGSFSGSIGWLTNPASGASSNYLIDKDGTIYELVPPDQDAWANGAVAKPDTGNPLIKRWLAEGVNFNQRTVSIETARETSANEQPGGFTGAQHQALVNLTAWLCSRFGLPPDRTHVLRHAQIDSVNRQHCPGLAESEMTAWIGEIAALVGGTAPPAPPVASGEGVYPSINAKGEAELLINFSGVATGIEGVDIQDVGITVVNAAGERYARSVQGNTFGAWHKIG